MPATGYSYGSGSRVATQNLAQLQDEMLTEAGHDPAEPGARTMRFASEDGSQLQTISIPTWAAKIEVLKAFGPGLV